MVDDEVLAAPDPQRPDAFFRDESDTFLVETLPRRMPAFLTEQRSASATGSVIFVVVQAVVGRLLSATDARWKVVVRRRRGRTLAFFRTIALEECPSENAADMRRVEILANWHSYIAKTKPSKRI